MLQRTAWAGGHCSCPQFCFIVGSSSFHQFEQQVRGYGAESNISAVNINSEARSRGIVCEQVLGDHA